MKQNTGDTVKANLPEREGQARDQAAELFGVGGRSVSDAKYVAENDPSMPATLVFSVRFAHPNYLLPAITD